MTSEVLIGVLSLIGTLIGILASNRLVTYRLEQLEAKVSAHNNLIERMYKCEDRLNIVEHDIADIRKDVDDGK